MKKKFLILSLLLLIIFTPSRIYSHSGGPPFITVNDKYAFTNPIFQNTLEADGLTIPQDLTEENYLKGSTLTFKVDIDALSQFGIDPLVADKTQFRFSFFKGYDFKTPVFGSLEGAQVKQVFPDPGSYLVVFELKPEGENAYSILDTILINIIPGRNYKVLQSRITIISPLQTEQNSTFINNTAGTGLTYFWSIDGSIKKGREINHDFKQEYYFDLIQARVIDKYGIISDVGIQVVADNGKLEFASLKPQQNSESLQVVKKSSYSAYFPVIIAVAILILASVIIAVMRRRRNNTARV